MRDNRDSYGLLRPWTFYEVYENYPKKSDKQKQLNYLENINSIATFDNIIDFVYF